MGFMFADSALFSRALLGLLVLSLSACVATYKAADEGVAGFRDLQIDDTRYYVEYTEASRVEWDRLHRFVLRRSAELAKQRGFKAFDVLEKNQSVVYLRSDVDEVAITTMGLRASDPPVTHRYQTEGRVEGRRVTYKIELIQE